MIKKDEVMIPAACHANWPSMSPRDAGRFCGECQTVVHDLSSMSEREAEVFLASASSATRCVRYTYDAQNGALVFANSPSEKLEKVVPVTLLVRAKRLAQSTAALALPLALAACSRPHKVDASMGLVAPSERPTVTDAGNVENRGMEPQATTVRPHETAVAMGMFPAPPNKPVDAGARDEYAPDGGAAGNTAKKNPR